MRSVLSPFWRLPPYLQVPQRCGLAHWTCRSVPTANECVSPRGVEEGVEGDRPWSRGRLRSFELRDSVEDRVLAREGKLRSEGHRGHPSVGFVLLGHSPWPLRTHRVLRQRTRRSPRRAGASPWRKSRGGRGRPRRRAPHPATSAPKRISATTVKGRTHWDWVSTGCHLVLRAESRTASQALATIVSTTIAEVIDQAPRES